MKHPLLAHDTFDFSKSDLCVALLERVTICKEVCKLAGSMRPVVWLDSQGEILLCRYQSSRSNLSLFPGTQLSFLVPSTRAYRPPVDSSSQSILKIVPFHKVSPSLCEPMIYISWKGSNIELSFTMGCHFKLKSEYHFYSVHIIRI